MEKKTVTLDARRMTTVRETHRYIAEKLDFPEYYGGNLDALYDCLGELNGARIVIENADTLRWSLGCYTQRLTEAFEAAAADGSVEFELR